LAYDSGRGVAVDLQALLKEWWENVILSRRFIGAESTNRPINLGMIHYITIAPPTRQTRRRPFSYVHRGREVVAHTSFCADSSEEVYPGDGSKTDQILTMKFFERT
jgi:hypothetical protein